MVQVLSVRNFSLIWRKIASEALCVLREKRIAAPPPSQQQQKAHIVQLDGNEALMDCGRVPCCDSLYISVPTTRLQAEIK
jgi:hypothetical protein